MTLNLYDTQQDILDHAKATMAWEVYDTDVPTAETVLRLNNRAKQYALVRFNDASVTSGGKAMGGARRDEMFTYVDMFGIGATPSEAREVVWGAAGAMDTMLGYKPVDGGPLAKAAGGLVFEVSDANARPAFFIARCSFRLMVNVTNVSG